MKRIPLYDNRGLVTLLEKMNEKQFNKLIDKIENGHPISTIGDLFGFTKKTFYDFLNHGRKYIETNPKERNGRKKVYGNFFVTIIKSRAKYRYNLIKKINKKKVNKEEWIKNFRLLSHRDFKNWGSGLGKRIRESKIKNKHDERFL